MKTAPYKIKIGHDIVLGENKLVIFAGPCALESEETTFTVAEALFEIQNQYPVSVVFKSSFDKANRTSIDSYRSMGIDKGLELLSKVRSNFGFPLITDVHETNQVNQVAHVVDVLQIPAFLARQTDLVLEAARTGKPVNVKKSQFMSARDAGYALAKVNSLGFYTGFLTERGTFFGYSDLVVDFRSLVAMREFSPVVFDATHSVQQPGALGGRSGGQSWFVESLARAAVAVGIDGLFFETHPQPAEALSDGPNMVKSTDLPRFLESILSVRDES